jgi:hypothetical protein
MEKFKDYDNQLLRIQSIWLHHEQMCRVQAHECPFYLKNCKSICKKILLDIDNENNKKIFPLLQSITFNNCTFTSIGSNCFSECSSLNNIQIPNSVTFIGNACFFGCTSLSNIQIPNSVTDIGSACFYDCTSLTNFVIPIEPDILIMSSLILLGLILFICFILYLPL